MDNVMGVADLAIELWFGTVFMATVAILGFWMKYPGRALALAATHLVPMILGIEPIVRFGLWSLLILILFAGDCFAPDPRSEPKPEAPKIRKANERECKRLGITGMFEEIK